MKDFLISNQNFILKKCEEQTIQMWHGRFGLLFHAPF